MTGSFTAWETKEKVQASNIFPCLDSSLKGLLFYSRKGHLFLNSHYKAWGSQSAILLLYGDKARGKTKYETNLPHVSTVTKAALCNYNLV